MPRFGSIGVMSLFSLNGVRWVQQVALGKTPADWAPHPSAVGDSAAGQGEPGAAWEGGGHASPSLGAPA